ncbi:hypothetical protein B0H10DRAFT_1948532 [Mycena sp. CBHHK59/15]|nr:hypothetical protein B0H10DRAFT_1948532 [Mycena sp. CBHHK59/15]
MSKHPCAREGAWQMAQWRYNMETHLAKSHPEYASPLNPNGLKHLLNDVWETMVIQREEEIALGIPLEKILPKFTKIFNCSKLAFRIEPQFGQHLCLGKCRKRIAG